MRERSKSAKIALCIVLMILCNLPVPVPDVEAQTKMTIAYSSVSAGSTGVWMAKDSGAFDKYGIQADIVYISSGPVVLQALIGGDLQAGNPASNAVINAILNGAQIVGVAATANRPYHKLYVQPEINRIEDLKGKILGVTRFGSVTDNLTQILLRKYGLEDRVNIRQLGGVLEVGAAFQQRLIAGAITDQIRVPDHVPVKILIKLIDLGIPYSMNMITVSRDYLRRNTETVERLVRAYAEGVAVMNQQKEKALKIIAKYSRLTDPRAIETHYNESVTYLERTVRVEPEGVQTILEFMGKKGVPFDTFVDNTFIERLTREGFFDRLYKK